MNAWSGFALPNYRFRRLAFDKRVSQLGLPTYVKRFMMWSRPDSTPDRGA